MPYSNLILKSINAAWNTAQRAHRGVPYVPPGAATTPPAIFGANLIAWYKADAGITLSGSNVTAWADQSGNSHNLAPVGITGPQFSSTGFNTSFPAVTMPTDGDGLITSSAFNLGSKLASFFFVINLGTNTATNFAGACSYFDQTTADNTDPVGIIAVLRNGMTANSWLVFQNNNTILTGSITDGTNIRLSVTFDGTVNPTCVQYLSNVSNASGSSGTGVTTLGTATSKLTFGANVTRGTAHSMVYAEMVMVNVVANSTQRAAMDTYLKSRWGL